MVECTISTRVDGDVLKLFWSYCSEVGFVKVPRDNKSCIWVRGFLLTYIQGSRFLYLSHDKLYRV